MTFLSPDCHFCSLAAQKPLVVSFKDKVLKSGSKLEFKIHEKPVHDGFCVIVTGETPIGKPQAVKDCTVPEIVRLLLFVRVYCEFLR